MDTKLRNIQPQEEIVLLSDEDYILQTQDEVIFALRNRPVFESLPLKKFKKPHHAKRRKGWDY